MAAALMSLPAVGNTFCCAASVAARGMGASMIRMRPVIMVAEFAAAKPLTFEHAS